MKGGAQIVPLLYRLYEQNSCTGIPDVLTVIVKANDRVIIQLAAVRRRQEVLQCYCRDLLASGSLRANRRQTG